MKAKHLWAFDVADQLFHVTRREDGRLQLTSEHPGDDTEYHWAMKMAPYLWNIYRCGKKVSSIVSMECSDITPETMAAFLLKEDAEAQLVNEKPIVKEEIE